MATLDIISLYITNKKDLFYHFKRGFSTFLTLATTDKGMSPGNGLEETCIIITKIIVLAVGKYFMSRCNFKAITYDGCHKATIIFLIPFAAAI